jgi:hypothetical protein
VCLGVYVKNNVFECLYLNYFSIIFFLFVCEFILWLLIE